MKILITGNLGYVGPVLIRHLRSALPTGTYLRGYDTGFFGHCLTACNYLPECWLDEQIFGDTRTMPAEILKGVDAVVHLAAISNDPMGKEFEQATAQINTGASVSIAKSAKQAGVSHFVFASSCSIYGAAGNAPKREDDTLNPLTAYAHSKVKTEEEIQKFADENFVVTSLRFATACGMSPRLRLDLVLNDFVANAHLSGVIKVLSDGSPWRPLVHVEDMARAMEWAIVRQPGAGDQYLAVNVGSRGWTWQMGELAQAVADVLGGVTVSINMDASPDKRSYTVDFSLFELLAPDHQPQTDFANSIEELLGGIKRLQFANADFRESSYIRLRMLREHLSAGRLDQQLYRRAPNDGASWHE